MISSLDTRAKLPKLCGQAPAQMSNINIKRAVENIHPNTSAYTPLVEAIVNAIQAIEETGRNDGKISIRIKRSRQMELDEAGLPEIIGFEIEDNGIGFTDRHRNSFDTLYSDLKEQSGGKGFGRLTALKYFKEVRVSSIYKEGDAFHKRSFSMGREHEIIVNEEAYLSAENETGSTLYLSNLKTGSSLDKKAETLARNLVERLLPYFIAENYTCPQIALEDEEGEPILLNNFIGGHPDAIQEIRLEPDCFPLATQDGQEEGFRVRLFKLYAPRHQSNRISLVAHQREVSKTPMKEYTPEFSEEFIEAVNTAGQAQGKNYIIIAYVFGEYLDKHVSLERDRFLFSKEPDMVFPIGQSQIEEKAAKLSITAFSEEIHVRQEKKKARVQEYVDKQAPWYKRIVKESDLSGIAYRPTEEQIEAYLHKEKFTQERRTRQKLKSVTAAHNFSEVKAQALEVISDISEEKKDELIHYMALRSGILSLLERSLQRDKEGRYSSEQIVHDIIFPRKGDSDQTAFLEHNLWLLDERLNFTEYASSDIPVGMQNKDRPDILAYNRRVMFRGDNVASNPITIFEFKRPGRDDFANPSSTEDPVAQIVRYVNALRDGNFQTPKGRKINIEKNTPAYGYIICDINKKIEKWLHVEKDFKPMPDNLGWFRWQDSIHLYMEVISWDKLLNDATMRNKIFFDKLGIVRNYD